MYSNHQVVQYQIYSCVSDSSELKVHVNDSNVNASVENDQCKDQFKVHVNANVSVNVNVNSGNVHVPVASIRATFPAESWHVRMTLIGIYERGRHDGGY